MNKEAKHTISFLIVLVVSFLAVDRAFGELAYALLSNMPYGDNETGRLKFHVQECESDVIVFGSSRAAHHYVTEMLSEQLSVDVYNCGREGNGISYAYGVLKTILRRKTPHMVILECGLSEYNPDWLEKVSTMKPYFREYPELKEIDLTVNGRRESIKCSFSSYRFNSTLLQIAKTYLMSSEDKMKGYVPLYGKAKAKDLLFGKPDTTFTLPPVANQLLEDFVKTCNANDIDLICFFSPIYMDRKTTSDIIGERLNQLKVHFVDYSNDSFFMKNSDFFTMKVT